MSVCWSSMQQQRTCSTEKPGSSPSAGLSCSWKGSFVTGAFKPCFKSIWASDFPYVLRMDKPWRRKPSLGTPWKKKRNIPNVQQLMRDKTPGNVMTDNSRMDTGVIVKEVFSLIRSWWSQNSGSLVGNNKGQKKHINSFNINFLVPNKEPSSGTQRKSWCASFPGKKTQKRRDPHKLFRKQEGFWGNKKRSPKRAAFGHKKFSLLFFLPLNTSHLYRFYVEFMLCLFLMYVWASCTQRQGRYDRIDICKTPT